MEFTKKQAVEEHRKMWNWIADQLENGIKKEVYRLKQIYCKENGFDLLFNCFCCQYNEHTLTDSPYNCDACPILWGSEDYELDYFCEPYHATASYTEAQILSSEGKYKKAAKIARKIANLPERPDNEYDILEKSDTNG